MFYLTLMSLIVPADAAAASNRLGNLPADLLIHSLSYISDVDLLETLMSGPEFIPFLKDIERFAALQDGAAVSFFRKFNKEDISAVVDFTAVRESYLSSLGADSQASAGLLAIAERFLALRQELVVAIDQSMGFNFENHDEAFEDNLFERGFKAVGLLASTNLRYLRLNDTPVRDLSPLSTLKDLEGLDLRGTLVTDLSPLATLTNLKGLYMEGVQADVTPLAFLEQGGLKIFQ